MPVSIYLVNGIKLQGQIDSFDQFVVLLKNSVSQMVYKHAISTVVPARNVRLTEEGAVATSENSHRVTNPCFTDSLSVRAPTDLVSAPSSCAWVWSAQVDPEDLQEFRHARRVSAGAEPRGHRYPVAATVPIPVSSWVAARPTRFGSWLRTTLPTSSSSITHSRRVRSATWRS